MIAFDPRHARPLAARRIAVEAPARRAKPKYSMRKLLYNVLRRTLSQERRTRLKRRIAHGREQLAPLYRFRYGGFGAAELVHELERHIPSSTEIVMVHCSLNDLQPTYTGDARQLLDALIEFCLPDRTLVMPTFVLSGERSGGETYTPRVTFDARRQPSEMGLLSELFRRRSGVRRSLHPTASVAALGPLAAELVAEHHLAPTSFGEGTPFAFMAGRPTAIVGIGTEYFRCLTQVHAAEDLLGARFPVRLRPSRIWTELRGADGTVHAYALAFDPVPVPRRLDRLERLLGSEELVQWRFHGVPLFVTSAARVTDVLAAAAARGETIYDEKPIRSSG